MSNINNKALFLGVNAENADFFHKELTQALQDHVMWRRNLYPTDKDIVTQQDKDNSDFKATETRITQVLATLSERLQQASIPWHSPRYLGHMNAETLTPAIIAYFSAMLYNPNNVAYESSAPTSVMEIEAGEDLCKLMGMETGWAHLSADGSIANYEGLWYARNIKSLPLAMKRVYPELVEGLSDWELLNLPISRILELFEQSPDKVDLIKNNSVRAIAGEVAQLGKWIIPKTKHYSWIKACDVLGIGTDDIVQIEVDDRYRMNINKLKETIDELVSHKTPILGLVAIIGTTEEGAIDRIDEIINLKREYSKQGINFYLHIDAAYGGYARSIFLDENYKFIDWENLAEKYKEYNIFHDHDFTWPTKDVYNAFKAMSEADSITIDPHKMGYIPYSAGGIVIKDSRMKESISYFASYVFEKNAKIPALLGSFIMEGSKAGATAAAVWAAHRVLPVNITGYGKLIGASIESANSLFRHLSDTKYFIIDGQKVNIEILTKPDFNMVDFVFNIEGNTSLAKMNLLNKEIYTMSSIFSGDVLGSKFLVSHTIFATDDYLDSPVGMLARVGIDKQEWDSEGELTILRSCVLTPYLNESDVSKRYFAEIDADIIHKLSIVLKKLIK